MRARACVLSKSVCVCLGRLGVNMSLQVCCVSAHLPHDTSPQLMHTWSPPPCPPPHPLPIRSTPETNQLGDPIQKGPLLQTLISCACQVPSTSGPRLSHPPQSSRRSAAPRPPWAPVAGPSRDWRPIYPFSPLFYTGAVQGPCSNLTGKLRHATPRLGCDDQRSCTWGGVSLSPPARVGEATRVLVLAL